MNKLKIYMITCDKSNHILNLTIPMLNKYWNIEKHVNVLGFSKPNIKFPLDYNFISMRPKQLSIDDWSIDIANVLENEKDEHIIFTLDDFTPIDFINVDVYNKLYYLVKNDNNIVRCSLGLDLYFNMPHTVIEKCDGFDIIEQSQISPFRITTQPSIWRKDYLIHILRKSKNPWHFETNNKANDGYKIIGTKGKYCYRWIEESSLSRKSPDKINILGMKPSDIKWCIENNILKENNIQYGSGSIDSKHIPQFNEYGFNFKIEILKNLVNQISYKSYYDKYKSFYE